jgi:hypothetical protein
MPPAPPNQPPQETLRLAHVTVIEEAHRLLANPSPQTAAIKKETPKHEQPKWSPRPSPRIANTEKD